MRSMGRERVEQREKQVRGGWERNNVKYEENQKPVGEAIFLREADGVSAAGV